MARRTLAARLLRWYDAARRDLPWRRTRDPWAIWVSEVMLQQTRVAAVRGRYEGFLARYPRPADFAAATDDELHRAWQGLGYYRRAHLLRAGARAVVAGHGGRLPRDPSALGALPGVGDYTRGALASIAFGRPEPAVDGNVERVVARLLLLRGDVRKAAARAAIRAAVEGWIDRARPGDFNQALMELGATVCTPAVPRCTACPLAAGCAARRAGVAAELPERAPRRAPTPVLARALVAFAAGGVLAMRVPHGEPNAGQWELPGAGILRPVAAADLARLVRERCGARVRVGPPLVAVRHQITHHRITLVAHAAEVLRRGLLRPQPPDGEAPWTTAARKVFARLPDTATSAGGSSGAPSTARQT